LLSRLDKKVLRISPVETLSALPESLSDLNAKLAPDGQIIIEYRSGTDSVTAMLNRVKAAGVSIADLRTEEADLEDVFMALTYAGDHA